MYASIHDVVSIHVDAIESYRSGKYLARAITIIDDNGRKTIINVFAKSTSGDINVVVDD